ncbi:MAG: DNA-binding protein WhiA [Oscillospiraceae bacterium]|jgi:DNA-binding protein WhiA|nr:DNA-binding protein WhiA [Oscillospiraceae bacterium]
MAGTSFSRSVKEKLADIRETGKAYKDALSRGVSYAASSDGAPIDPSVYGCDDEIAGIFLRGVFISCGHITDPGKGYHLELNLPRAEKCGELLDYMGERGMVMKISRRKGREFIYSKDSEQIADFLTYIGAGRYSMEIMNAKILKEIRNNVNRAVNCESANIERLARAASRRLADIEYIFRVKGKEFLPAHLRETAVLRLNNVEKSIEEIGRALNISKSAANGRLRKISEIADGLREREEMSSV